MLFDFFLSSRIIYSSDLFISAKFCLVLNVFISSQDLWRAELDFPTGGKTTQIWLLTIMKYPNRFKEERFMVQNYNPECQNHQRTKKTEPNELKQDMAVPKSHFLILKNKKLKSILSYWIKHIFSSSLI